MVSNPAAKNFTFLMFGWSETDWKSKVCQNFTFTSYQKILPHKRLVKSGNVKKRQKVITTTVSLVTLPHTKQTQILLYWNIYFSQ